MDSDHKYLAAYGINIAISMATPIQIYHSGG